MIVPGREAGAGEILPGPPGLGQIRGIGAPFHPAKGEAPAPGQPLEHEGGVEQKGPRQDEQPEAEGPLDGRAARAEGPPPPGEQKQTRKPADGAMVHRIHQQPQHACEQHGRPSSIGERPGEKPENGPARRNASQGQPGWCRQGEKGHD